MAAPLGLAFLKQTVGLMVFRAGRFRRGTIALIAAAGLYVGAATVQFGDGSWRARPWSPVLFIAAACLLLASVVFKCGK
jgi:hypothetical protein